MKWKISYFYIFDRRCYVLNSGKEHLNTFDAKSNEAIFLGYSVVSKAYKVYNRRTVVVEELPHAFYEPHCDTRGIKDLTKKTKELKIDKEAPLYIEVVDFRKIDDEAVAADNIGTNTTNSQNPLQPQESTAQPTAVRTQNASLESDLIWLGDHPLELVIGRLDEWVKTRRATQHEVMLACFLS